jgi:hypothetical protein
LIFLAGQAIATGISLQKSGPILFRSRQLRLLHPQRRVVVAPLGVVPAVLAAQPRRMLARLLQPMHQLQQAEVPVAAAMQVQVQRQQMTATAVR